MNSDDPPLELHPLDFSVDDLSKLTSLQLALVCFINNSSPKVIHQSRILFLQRRMSQYEGGSDLSIVCII